LAREVTPDERGLSRLVVAGCVAFVTIASGAIVATILAFAGTPHAILAASARAEGSRVVISLAHRGGDTFATGDLLVLAGDATGLLSSVDMLWGERFSPGDEATGSYEFGGDASGAKVVLKVVHRPTRQVLLDLELTVEA
jgi:hypothetical protein